MHAGTLYFGLGGLLGRLDGVVGAKAYRASLGGIHSLWEDIEYTVLHHRPDLHSNHLRIFDHYVFTLPFLPYM